MRNLRYYFKKIKIYNFIKKLYIYIKYIVARLLRGDLNHTLLETVEIIEFINLSDKNHHIFFGYYDKSPVLDNKIIYLSNSIGDKNKSASIYLYDIVRKEFFFVDTTTAWNWQQGCMLQWSNTQENTILYNTYDQQTDSYKAKVYDFNKKSFCIYDRPIYSQSRVNSHYLSINFKRLHAYTEGYGYSNHLDIVLDDTTDGIWEFNMKTNRYSFLVSIDGIKNYMPVSSFNNAYHYINHVDYCIDENKIIFIHRWCGKDLVFTSRLLLFDKKTKKIETLLNNKHISHYCWKSEECLLIYATNSKGERGFFDINIYSHRESDLYANMPNEDGHPSFNDIRNLVLIDTYPNDVRKQSLFLYDNTQNKLKKIKDFYSPFKYFDGDRCDLHPRWSKDFQWISVDTTFTGNRSLYFLKIKY